jgi:hypothetical protein
MSSSSEIGGYQTYQAGLEVVSPRDIFPMAQTDEERGYGGGHEEREVGNLKELFAGEAGV